MEENNINYQYIYSSNPSSPITRKKGEGYKRSRGPKDPTSFIHKSFPNCFQTSTYNTTKKIHLESYLTI
jgi:hypothetical protein